MQSLVVIVLTLYTLCLVIIFVFTLAQFRLAIHYRKSLKRLTPEFPPSPSEWPQVTIQLPLYNEAFVVGRLIDAVCAMNYPPEKMLIQVLDDSTDDTAQIAADIVQRKKQNGFRIEHIQRTDRTGYKAGALSFGLTTSTSPFVAIFDADFLPPADFLKRSLPFLISDEKLCTVQGRWGHLNEQYSLLTKLQAFALDAHFTVEQAGRQEAQHFLNFNGTAGVWRTAAITDAGGWQHDTLTEDLDLSYRAQLKGWRIRYVKDLIVPAELPIDMNALKSQQFRWTKGAAENARKNLAAVWANPSLQLSHKIHGTFHLLNASVFLCVLLLAMLSVPIIHIKERSPFLATYIHWLSLFLVGTVLIGWFYWTSMGERSFAQRTRTFVIRFPLFLAISMGLSLHNSVAMMTGLLGKKTAFIRTPKFGHASTASEKSSGSIYRDSRPPLIVYLEALLALYFIFGIGYGLFLRDYGLLPFHLMLVFGFGSVAWLSWRHSRLSVRG